MASLVTAWQTSLPSSGYDIVSPVVIQNNVYMASNGYVYRLDFYSGVVIATNGLEGRGHNEVRLAASADGSFLFVGTDGYVLSLNPTTLDTLWQTSLPGCGYNIVSVLHTGGIVYAGSNGYVYRLDPSNGQVLYTNGLDGLGHNEVRLAMTLANDVLLVGTYGYCVGLSPSNLATLWERSLPGCGYDITSVAGGNGCGYAACAGYVYQLNASNGNVTNQNNLSGTGKSEVRLALRGDGVHLFVGTNGYGISLSASNLSTIYSISLPGSGYTITDVAPGTTTAFFANNGYVFQLNDAGNIVSTNSLPGLGEHETRLAASASADVRIFAGINGYGVGLFAVSPQPHDAWMSALASTIGPKMLREVKIPGTHDSATYAITPLSSIGKDMPDWLEYIQLLPLPGNTIQTVMSLWSVAQTVDFTGQLKAGIRYFDLRVQGSSLNFVHGLVSAPVTDLLTQLSAYLSTAGNDKEVVLLDFNHFYDMKPADHANLVSMLQTTFGNKLAPASLGANVTLNQLWSTSYRIIIFYDDAATVGANPFLWSQSTISSPWPNVQDVGALNGALARELPNKLSTFFVLQGILTPNGAMIALGLVGVGPRSLTAVAQAVTPAVVGWLSQWTDQGINIVICDWFNCTNAYVDILLQMNSTQATAADAASLQTVKLIADRPPVAVASHVDPEKVKREIANGVINEASIAALAAAEYRARFGRTGHSQEVIDRLQELDRIAATASAEPKKLGEKPPVVQSVSKLGAKAEAKNKE
ncbi:Phosphatidylinositol-specific phospholipase C domain-containing protein [Mycena sanguinolenta]|uniref:Phosphatidylinositol-specific phospholipase C domain-containing protein n=1 Tax=Mycena sanguinolenta TaxID=230812 RepID=A0A8H6XG88_9AGAR|nr:Phosphatidylinositol-specific phospholipase C domain-containing protein [Mycena sanguinolenta]